MRASMIFAILAVFPSSLLLTYLAMHVTEGWQFMIVCAFLSLFVVAWLRRSRGGLAIGYALTVALSVWVFSVNS